MRRIFLLFEVFVFLLVSFELKENRLRKWLNTLVTILLFESSINFSTLLLKVYFESPSSSRDLHI
jgi:hypothetical protein